MTAPFPLPDRNGVGAPYWAALAEGRLQFQRCTVCGHAWLPPRAECPACLGDVWTWETATGRGRLVTWVVYHIAYHEAFADRLPYNVAVVELEEGPRLITNIVNPDAPGGLAIERPVELAIAAEHGVALARFRLA
jgi:uncharacterized OB-fold protein